MLLSKIIHNSKPTLQRTLATFSKDSKRFYQDVDVLKTSDGYQVTLDGKFNVRTPLRNLLVLPTETLANAVAVEWDSQRKNIIFALMPLTSLCFKATHKPVESEGLVEHMLEFLRTDTVCYRAGPDEEQLQSLENSRCVINSSSLVLISQLYHLNFLCCFEVLVDIELCFLGP